MVFHVPRATWRKMATYGDREPFQPGTKPCALKDAMATATPFLGRYDAIRCCDAGAEVKMLPGVHWSCCEATSPEKYHLVI